MDAATLIAKTRERDAPQVSAEALRELRALCKHNDSCKSHMHRVSAPAAREMLASLGTSAGLARLDRICREQLGRKSWARP